MRHLFALLVFLLSSFLLAPAFAQALQPTGCDGPPELCQEVKDLTAKLQAEKDAKAAVTKDEGKKVETKVAVAVAQDDKKKSDRTAKLIAMAGTLAVGLKMLLTVLDNWKGYFTSIKGKAVLKLITVAVGFVAFMATNIGFGLPFWQALILAGGGPGALLVHDIVDIIPALSGKKQQKADAEIATKVAAVVASSTPPPSA
jgi:hypothetical protein